MKTEVNKGDRHQVTLKVEAGAEDLEMIIDEAYRGLSNKLKVPGFRKGKVPRQVIDSQLGAENVRKEAIRDGLPTLFMMGVIDSGILPVSGPEISGLEIGDDGSSVVFEAKVDVKPEVEVKDYMGIKIEKPDTEVTEEDLKRALDEARDRFATLEVAEGRPVEDKDYVLFDYKVFTDGVPVEGSSGSDRMIQVGSADFLPGFDEQLVGARKGDILDVIVSFPPEYEVRELAGKPATFRTIVKEVKRKVLPPLDDGLAREISHFETLDEFKEDLKGSIATIKEAAGERLVREKVVGALVDSTYIDLPESMVKYQIDGEIGELEHDLSERGITLDEYLEALKGRRYELEKAIRERVEENLKAELVVDAVASSENVEVSDEEAEEYIRETAKASGGDPDKVFEQASRQGRIPVVKANMRLSKAVDLLVENAVFKGGEPVKPAEPEPEVAEAEEGAAEETVLKEEPEEE
ncbi:MAG: trigger factor [Actinobacteria bacterium]|nr:trigger factor [Actinomycetota bacterium]